jgi:hypothetical protein
MLLEMMEEAMEEQEYSKNIKMALDAIKTESENMGFTYEIFGKNKIKIRAENREAVMAEMEPILSRFGFQHHEDGSSLGRLQLKTPGNRDNVYVVFKQPVGANPATFGNQAEKKIADRFNELSNGKVEATSAGAGHGSDIKVVGPKGTLTIENKTSLGADFGQFRLRYNMETEEWEPTPTKGYNKNKHIFLPIYTKYAKDYVDRNYTMPLPKDLDKIKETYSVLKSKFITGLKPSDKTAERKRALEKSWFDGKTGAYHDFPFSEISNYYADKDDRFINIGRKGLFALNPIDAKAFGIEEFANTGLSSRVRLRLKPSSGANSSTGFVVAIKVKGKLNKSNISLDNDQDILKLINLIS